MDFLFRNVVPFLGAMFLVAGQIQAADPSSNSAEKTAIAVEALKRLKGVDLESNPALKKAFFNILEATKGTAQFVELVRDFNIRGQTEHLMQIALQNPQQNFGADAARLILEEEGLKPFEELLEADTALAKAAAATLSQLADKRIVPLLQQVITQSRFDPTVQKQAVRSLAQTPEGAGALFALAKKDELPAALQFQASTELNQARWPEIRAQAAEILPLPQAADAEPLPPISTLVKSKGDPVRGEKIYFSESAACMNCHQVHGRGIDFGPNLSEIGTKLGKDALYESILNPNAGISFGYEGWQIELQDGEELFGILISDTPVELVIKTQNGLSTRFKKSDVVKAEKMKNSVMPTGLQQAMSKQDLIDLVEYLSTLKKSS